MSSQNNEGDPFGDEQRLFEMLKARMTANAFHHRSLIDVRTGHVLEPLGLVNSSEPTEADTARLIAIICDSEHEKRVQTMPGPLICYMEDDETRRSIIDVRDLLLARETSVRRCAINYIEVLQFIDEPMLAPRSNHVFEQAKDDVLSRDDARWHAAAVRLFDAFSDDFFVHLAGFLQCRDLRYQEGANAFLGRLLRPSTSSLESIRLDVAVPSNEQDEIKRILERCVALESSPENACNLYFQSLGHLPLDHTLGLSRALTRWLGSVSPDEVWERLWRWADTKASPLARYHVCQVFIEHPALIPAAERQRMWEEVLDLVGQLSPGRSSGSALMLRQDLARHYASYLECQLPGQESERIANLSWWLAERVGSSFGGSPNHLAKVRENVVRPELSLSTYAWKLVRPQLTPSTLQYATLEVASVWSLSTLCQLSAFPETLEEIAAEPEQLSDMVDVMLGAIIGGFPSPTVPAVVVFAFDRPLSEAGDACVSRLSVDHEKLDALQLFLNLYKAGSKEDVVIERINALASVTKEQQMFAIRPLRALVRTGELESEIFLKQLLEGSSPPPILLGIDPDTSERILDALVDAQQRAGGKWNNALPHILASTILSGEVEGDGLRLLFAFCVISSIAGNTVSPIRRVAQNKVRTHLEHDIRHWRDRCSEIFDYGIPWAQSRLRPIFSVLSEMSS